MGEEREDKPRRNRSGTLMTDSRNCNHRGYKLQGFCHLRCLFKTQTWDPKDLSKLVSVHPAAAWGCLKCQGA